MAVLLPAAIAATIFRPPPYAFSSFNLSCPAHCFPFNSFFRPRLKTNARSLRLHSALSPQPPQQPDPPPEKDAVRPQGIGATLTKVQDRVQIFFAVLFWMSLFFWASAFDRKNSDSGRPNKGSRFKR